MTECYFEDCDNEVKPSDVWWTEDKQVCESCMDKIGDE